MVSVRLVRRSASPSTVVCVLTRHVHLYFCRIARAVRDILRQCRSCPKGDRPCFTGLLGIVRSWPDWRSRIRVTAQRRRGILLHISIITELCQSSGFRGTAQSFLDCRDVPADRLSAFHHCGTAVRPNGTVFLGSCERKEHAELACRLPRRG